MGDRSEEASDGHDDFEWPEGDRGSVPQVAKYADALKDHPELYPMSKFPGGFLPDADVTRLGVRRVEQVEVLQLMAEGFLLVDVRKDKDVRKVGVITGSVHLEYRYEGYTKHGVTRLTADHVQEIVSDHAGIVFMCNGRKCPRSLNASLVAVQEWGVPSSKVRWFRDGIPSWTHSLLIPDQQLALASLASGE